MEGKIGRRRARMFIEEVQVKIAAAKHITIYLPFYLKAFDFLLTSQARKYHC